MRDDFLTREWVDGRSSLIADIHKLFTLTMQSFERLSAYQFDAPWSRPEVPTNPVPRF